MIKILYHAQTLHPCGSSSSFQSSPRCSGSSSLSSPLSPGSLTSEPPNDVISYLIDRKSFSYSNHRSMARSAERKSSWVAFIIPANTSAVLLSLLYLFNPLPPTVSSIPRIGRSLGRAEEEAIPPGCRNNSLAILTDTFSP